MKINTQNLKKALNFVKSGIAKKSILPVLSHIHLVSREGKLFVESTDLNCFYRSKVSDEKEQIKTMIPASEFISFVSSSKEEEIDIKFSEEKQELTVKSGKSKISLRTMQSEDFPIESTSLELLEQVNTQEFFSALKKTSFYSDDVTKSILCSINMISNGKEITFASTDGYRLIVNKIEQSTPAQTLNLPGETMSKIATMILKEDDDQTNILIGENKIAFQTEDCYVSTRVMEGKFPDFNKILPKSSSQSFSINRNELVSVLKTSRELLDKNTNIVNFNFSSDGLIVSGSNSYGKIESELDFKGFNDQFIISFNEGYLSNALAQIDSDVLVMKCNSNTQPVLLFDQEESESTTIMLMPIKP